MRAILSDSEIRDLLSESTDESMSRAKQVAAVQKPGKTKRSDRISEPLDELKEFKKLCKERRSMKNRYLWSKVLDEVDQFKESIRTHIDSINATLPDLAEFYLRDPNTIDLSQLKLVIAENERLQKDHSALGEAIKTINTMDHESFGSPAKLAEKLSPVTGSMVSKLIPKILEHHQIIQGIQTNHHLQLKRRELLEKKIKAFKGIDESAIDTTELELRAETCRLDVLEIKLGILSDYQDNAEQHH